VGLLNLTCGGTAAWGTGTVGSYAASFNGSNNACKFTSIPTANDRKLDFSTSNFTVAFWAKTNVTGTPQNYVCAKTNHTATSWAVFYGFVINLYEFYCEITSGTSPRTNSRITVSNTNWNHIAYSYDGTTFSKYLNGSVTNYTMAFTVKNYTSATPPLFVNDDWTVGGENVSNVPWDGLIDDLTVWNRKLTDAEVTNLYNKIEVPGYSTRYKCEENIGSILYDNPWDYDHKLSLLGAGA
jgi:hypothetical protein